MIILLLIFLWFLSGFLPMILILKFTGTRKITRGDLVVGIISSIFLGAIQTAILIILGLSLWVDDMLKKDYFKKEIF